MREIKAEELNENIFNLIGKDWMLVGAEKNGKVNAMTASWGFGGIMWGKAAVEIGIRPQRYTKEFVDGADTFSLTILAESDKNREIMNYFGTVSGRDEDKIKNTGLRVEYAENTPYFQEGKVVFICRKMYSQKLEPDNFIDKTILDKWYPNKDYHEMYVAEIIKVLVKQ